MGLRPGYMVPRSDMNRSLTAIVNTFFLTNMTPQHPNVNQGAWARLEDWVAGGYRYHFFLSTAASALPETLPRCHRECHQRAATVRNRQHFDAPLSGRKSGLKCMKMRALWRSRPENF